MEIKVLKDILSANDQIAQENRQLIDSNGVNIIESDQNNWRVLQGWLRKDLFSNRS
jgi:hypothetical protein